VQLPFAVPALVEWGKNTLSHAQRDGKRFFREYALSIGVPEETAWRRNVGWKGHYDWVRGDVERAMAETVESSPFREVVGWSGVGVGQRGLFRKYSLCLWLENTA